jgi:opacity protein-like surface antigen
MAPPAYVPGGWYLGAAGGWDMQNSIKWDDALGAYGEVKTNDNALALGSIGYRFPASPFRLEVEGGYSWHDIDTISDQSLGIVAQGSGHVNLGHVLANAIYDFPIAPRWAISIGAGAGMGFADYTVNAPITGSLSKTGFMWQGIGGLTFNMAPNLDLFSEYRYRNAQTGTSVALPGDSLHVHGITENAVIAGLRWYLSPPW